MAGSYKNDAERSSSATKFISLAYALVIREFKGTYRRSVLGPMWAILQPLMYMAIFIFLRGVLEIQSDGVPYAVFVFSALVPWTFFSNAISRATPSIYTNATIVKKVALPREVFPLSGLLVSLIDLLISSLILVLMLVWYEIEITAAIAWFPVLVFMTCALAFGVSLATAALGTFKRDIIFAMPFLMQFWLLATPVMYPLSEVPDRWQFLFAINPMVGIVDGFRNILVKGVPPAMDLILPSCVAIVILYAIAWPLFRRVTQYAADVL